MKIILASASPRRKNLLKEAGIPFTVEVSNYEEDMSLRLKPLRLAEKLSEGKARAVAQRHKGENVLVIGADTFIVFKNKLLGKPRTLKEAKEMIKELSGNKHSVITGFTVINAKSGKKISKAIKSSVYFRKLKDEEIENYVNREKPLDKAAAYAIQEGGSALMGRVEGDYTNIVGLPMPALIKELKKFGINI